MPQVPPEQEDLLIGYEDVESDEELQNDLDDFLNIINWILFSFIWIC